MKLMRVLIPISLLIIIPFVITGCRTDSGRLIILRGNYYYRHGEYDKSLLDYFNLLTEKKRSTDEGDAILKYDIGNVYFMLGEFDSAVSKYLEIVQSKEKEVRFRASFNLACIYYQAGDYGKAARFFRKALSEKPSDIDTKINLELTLKKLFKAEEERLRDTGKAKRGNMQNTALKLLEHVSVMEEKYWRSKVSKDTSKKYTDW